MGVLLLSEIRRIMRSPRFVIFTVVLPVAYFLLFSELYATGGPDDPQVLVVLMVNMAAFGGIAASITTGGRVAVERAVGWNRQLRLTPLPGWAYLGAKAVVSMLVALPSLVLVYALAALKGVMLDPGTWLAVFLAAWIGILPFAAIGLLIGSLASQDSAQGMSMVTMLVFSLLGGILIPAQVLPPVMLSIAHALPSFWMANIASLEAFGGDLPLDGIAVMVAWFVVIGALAIWRYRRDALRV
jgi:ABC-2 type transport system permease protein